MLVYKKLKQEFQFLLVHPGGPFWKNKDAGAWSIPKGEFLDDEEPLSAAKREFEEETGLSISGKFLPLTPVKQKSGKLIVAWAVESDIDVSSINSNLFEMEWPPRSGKMQSFAEIDKAGWFTLNEAKEKIIESQFAFIEELVGLLK